MSSHPLKHVVPAALLSAVVVVLTFGVSVAQGALIRGRGAPAGTLPTGHGGTSVGLFIAAVAVAAVIVAAIAYAVVADRRQPTPVEAAGEPARFAADKREAEQERKAA